MILPQIACSLIRQLQADCRNLITLKLKKPSGLVLALQPLCHQHSFTFSVLYRFFPFFFQSKVFFSFLLFHSFYFSRHFFVIVSLPRSFRGWKKEYEKRKKGKAKKKKGKKRSCASKKNGMYKKKGKRKKKGERKERIRKKKRKTR